MVEEHQRSSYLRRVAPGKNGIGCWQCTSQIITFPGEDEPLPSQHKKLWRSRLMVTHEINLNLHFLQIRGRSIAITTASSADHFLLGTSSYFIRAESLAPFRLTKTRRPRTQIQLQYQLNEVNQSWMVISVYFNESRLTERVLPGRRGLQTRL